AVKGRWLEAGEGVMPEDLEAAEQAQGVRIEAGDILLIRTGYYARRLREPRNPGKDGSPAAHVASMPCFRARDIAMLGTDTHNDVSPLSHPGLGNVVHIVGLVGMGLWLIDNGNLEGLAQACGALGATPIRDLIRARTESSAFAVRLTRRSATRLSSFDGTSPKTRMVTGDPRQSGTRTVAVRGNPNSSGSPPSASEITPFTAMTSPSRLSRKSSTLAIRARRSKRPTAPIRRRVTDASSRVEPAARAASASVCAVTSLSLYGGAEASSMPPPRMPRRGQDRARQARREGRNRGKTYIPRVYFL